MSLSSSKSSPNKQQQAIGLSQGRFQHGDDAERYRAGLCLRNGRKRSLAARKIPRTTTRIIVRLRLRLHVELHAN